MYDVSALGFGDNVVDKYEHIKTMYPGGNCVNFAVYAKMFGAKRSAYMGYFGNDAEAEHVMYALDDIGIETVKCKQLEGENGCARATLVDGDRVFLGSNEGGIRGKTPYVLDRFDLEYIRQFDFVHSGNYCFMEKELPKIREAGVPISFDFSDDSEDSYYAVVAPFLVGKNNPLYSVNDVYNGIFVHGNVLGDAMFYGSGAGKLPTASAVVADVVDEAKHLHENMPNEWNDQPLPLADPDQVSGRFFVRVQTTDLSLIRSVFGTIEQIQVPKAEGETGFVTAQMTLGQYKAKAAEIKAEILSMIRIKD